MKNSYSNNKFKISVPTWNENFELTDGSYSIFYIQDIQDYFKYIIKKQETVNDNPPMKMYINKIENRVIFKLKWYIIQNFQHLKE